MNKKLKREPVQVQKQVLESSQDKFNRLMVEKVNGLELVYEGLAQDRKSIDNGFEVLKSGQDFLETRLGEVSNRGHKMASIEDLNKIQAVQLKSHAAIAGLIFAAGLLASVITHSAVGGITGLLCAIGYWYYLG